MYIYIYIYKYIRVCVCMTYSPKNWTDLAGNMFTMRRRTARLREREREREIFKNTKKAEKPKFLKV